MVDIILYKMHLSVYKILARLIYPFKTLEFNMI